MGSVSDARTWESIQRAVPLLWASVLLVKRPGSELGNALERNGLGPPLP